MTDLLDTYFAGAAGAVIIRKCSTVEIGVHRFAVGFVTREQSALAMTAANSERSAYICEL
jgi:hypothetical protein